MSPESEVRIKRSMSTKWRKYPEDILPAWIADMDIGIAPEIEKELIERITCGDLGYASDEVEARLLNAFSDRYLDKFNTPLDPELAIIGTDIVQSLQISVLTLTSPGGGVIIQTPIYPPFISIVANTGRRIQENPLQQIDGQWEIDFEQLAVLASDPDTNLMLLCNPHNPTGRVFTQEELVKIATICSDHDVTVVSDEIHCDIVYSPNYHIPFASISPEFATNVITMNSATKSYNLGGLRCSISHFGSPSLKGKYEAYIDKVRGSVSILSMLATAVAWEKCDNWLDSTLSLLSHNRNTLTEFVNTTSFGIRYQEPEGTYLGWLDFRTTKASSDPSRYLLENAKVALSPGPDFGEPGNGWARLNFATSPDILDDLLSRVANSF